MMYVDSSVLLAALLGEDRRPAASFWDAPLTTSRLTDYEVWVRLHVEDVVDTYRGEATRMLGRLQHLELEPTILDRVREPLPTVVRTLDALHLVTALFLAEQTGALRLATYDRRLARAAEACGLKTLEP